MSFRACVFDFNGTLSDDEHILYGVFADLFAEHGRPLTKADYFDTLAGLSDTAIVRTWLGERDDVDHLVGQRVSRYQAAVSDGASIGDGVRQAVRYAARRVPIAIVSGAAQAEIEPVLEAAGLLDAFTAVVTSDHVADGKPHPEGYLRALALLSENGGPPLAGPEMVAFEDTEAGVLSAKAAGLHCVGVLGTLAPERLLAADELVAMIDEPLMRRLLG